MSVRLLIQILLFAGGVAALGVLSFLVMFKVGAPVFLPGAIGCTVVIRVLCQRWEKSTSR
jgi:hypothetical protein